MGEVDEGQQRSSGSRNFGEGGGARNMKYKPPHWAAIFFWPIFTRQGGGPWPPCPHPGSSTTAVLIFHYLQQIFDTVTLYVPIGKVIVLVVLFVLFWNSCLFEIYKYIYTTCVSISSIFLKRSSASMNGKCAICFGTDARVI